jgi:hypothetical protein
MPVAVRPVLAWQHDPGQPTPPALGTVSENGLSEQRECLAERVGVGGLDHHTLEPGSDEAAAGRAIAAAGAGDRTGWASPLYW